MTADTPAARPSAPPSDRGTCCEHSESRHIAPSLGGLTGYWGCIECTGPFAQHCFAPAPRSGDGDPTPPEQSRNEWRRQALENLRVVGEQAEELAALRAALASQRAARARAEEDSKRLDAIERGDVTIECMGTTVPYQWVYAGDAQILACRADVNPRTLREAIDEALRASGQPEAVSP